MSLKGFAESTSSSTNWLPTTNAGFSNMEIARKKDWEGTMPIIQLTILSLVLSFSLKSHSQSCQATRAKPPKPTNMYTVAHVNKQDTGVHKSFLPHVSTTHDGRVGVARKGNSTISGEVAGIHIYLLKPEIEADVHRAPDGKPVATLDYDNLSGIYKRFSIQDLKNKYKSRLGNDETKVIPSGKLMHVTICEAQQNNPRYNSTNKYDVYYFNVIAFEEITHGSVRMWSFGIKAAVSNPKTTDATFHSVSLTDTFGRQTLNGISVGLEPSMTKDGQLMIVRTPIKYIFNETPCGVTGWTEPKEVHLGKDDPNVNTKYGLFKYPMRDALGARMTKIKGGGYPWMDPEGNNLFYLALNRKLGNNVDKRLPYTCSDGGSSCHITEDGGAFRGVTVIGLWTHGKAVLLDGMLNNVDYPASSLVNQQKNLLLYNGHTGGVRVNGNRFLSTLARRPTTGALFGNNSIMDSLVNKFNYLEHMRPTTPRDVVWKMTRGVYTDEVVFDEYSDPNYLIYSQMVGAVKNGYEVYYDGFQTRHRNNCYDGEVRVQNGATSYKYRGSVPSYGRLLKSDKGRIEPVSLGGIRGKGLYLTTGNGLAYTIKQAKTPISEEAYFSTFFDLRNSETAQWINLIQTPTYARVQVFVHSNGNLTKFRVQKGTSEKVFRFSKALKKSEWFHLAIHERSNWLYFTLNGNERVSFSSSGFDMKLLGHPSADRDLVIGSNGKDGVKGFNGWVDDVRLIANAEVYRLNPELACNMARGSMLSRVSGTGKQAEVDAYNLSSIGQGKLFCNTKYSFSTYEIADTHLGLSTTEFESVRHDLTQGSHIFFDQPRPNFQSNNFCLTCHIDNGDKYRPESLKISALVFDNTIDANKDPRRQPMQPPNIWNGLLPADYIQSIHNSNFNGPLRDQTECGKSKTCRIDNYLYRQ